MPLDEVAFSRLDWLWWGRIFNRVTRKGSHIFGFWRVRQFFTFTVSKRTRVFISRWKFKCSSFSLKNGSTHKNRKWLRWDRKKLHICSKVTKMGSIIGHRIERYNGVGALPPFLLPINMALYFSWFPIKKLFVYHLKIAGPPSLLTAPLAGLNFLSQKASGHQQTDTSLKC